ncbi:conserved Plasmodium protein, unknown function [Plasmodium malariae]|uniref:Uncharacterized protein n=1 Tax=Plasmodium malariae TaxID=5858 RepID=A0A1C3L0S9_PLAMA|nr:conserved Plasmodium protein, unknown function [Plasmodium malariae]
MTDYKTAITSIEEMKNICSELLNAKEDQVYNKLSLYYELEEKLKKVQPVITRIRLRRNETQEEKKIYGEKMIKNVDLLLERYDTLYTIYEEELTVFKENYEIEKNKIIEKKLLQEQVKKEYEEELLNRGRMKTKLEEQEIQLRNQEKLEFIKGKEEQYEKRKNQMETIKELIRQKCYFLYEEICSACDREEAINYIYSQLGVPSDKNKFSNDTVNNGGSPFNCVHLIDCLYLIYKNNEFHLFKEAVKNIIEYLEQLVRNIDNEQLKLINLMNKTFQHNILSKKGTLFVFILIGYSLKRSHDIDYVLKKINREINEENIYIYLEEPNIATDYTKWKKWFDNIQLSINILCTFFRHINKYSDIPDDEKVKSVFLFLKEKFENNVQGEDM